MRLALLLLAASLAHAQVEFEGKHVQLTPEGNIGRICTDSDTQKEIETLLKAPAPKEQNLWVNRVFIFRRTDADWLDSEGKTRHTKAEMNDEDVAGLKKAIDQLARGVEAYTGRLLKFDLQVRVIDEPLTKVSGGKGEHLAMGDATDPFIGKFIEEGKVDSVMVFWIPKDIQLGQYWGGTVGGCYKGAGYSSIAYVHPGHGDVHAYFEVALHEWLHQAEWARSEKLGYSDLPDLHMATQMGYAPDGVSRGWMDWYRDVMSVYFTPRMWRVISERKGDPDLPHPKGTGGFCREWLALGPFPNEADAGLDRAFIEEDGLRPAAGEEAGGKEWTQRKSGDDVMDIKAVMSPNENVVSYLHAYIDVEAEGPARLWVGSDDGVKAWWNGRCVLQRHVHRPCVKDQDRADVRLKKGWNRLLLKVEQCLGDWKACARLTDMEGKPLDVEWRATRPDGDIAADDAPGAQYVANPPSWKWDQIADDPWRILPEWTGELVGLETQAPHTRLTGGESYLLADVGEPVKGNRLRGDAKEADLDNELNFAREGIARVQVPNGAYFLVRPDVAPLLAARCVGDTPLFYAWVQHQRRPAFLVGMLRMAREPFERELSLVSFRDNRLSMDLRVRPELLVGGETVKATLELKNVGTDDLPLDEIAVDAKDGIKAEMDESAVPDLLRAGASATIHWTLAAPEEVSRRVASLLVARVRSGKEERRDVKAVDLRDAWEVSLETKDGRPADRALRGAAHPLVARVRNNLSSAVKGTLAVSAPEGWLAGGVQSQSIELQARGEETLDVPLALPASWDGAAEVRVTATPEEDAKDAGVHERSASLKLECVPWTIAGPFSNRDRIGFATAYAPEKGDDWTKPFDGAAGPVWAFNAGPPGLATVDHVHLLPLFEPHEWVVAYARIRVTSPGERKAQLRLGSDDTVTAWWNSRQVVAHEVYRAAAPDQEVLPITLRKGENDLVVKVCQGPGEWEFFFRITNPDGKEIPGLKYESR